MFFLYHPRTRPTGRVLARALSFPHWGVRPPAYAEVLLRWGSVRAGEYEHVINPIRGINNASDKLTTLTLLRDEGLPVPEFTTAAPMPHGDIWMGRFRRGFGGRDIDLIEPWTYASQGRDFWTRYIPNDREYRVHVVGDEVVRLQRKYLERPEMQASPYVRNCANGYVFRAPRRELNHDRYETAIAAVKALGLDFGAVDAVIDYEGKFWVLEVNTAPALSPLTAQAYVDALVKLIDERTGRYPEPNYNILELLRQEGEYDASRETSTTEAGPY